MVCGRGLSFGALGLLLALGCSSSSLGWLCWCLSFGASGLLPAVRCLFVFCFGGFAPLSCLSSSWWLGRHCPLLLVAAVGVSLLVPCGFCPPWGVSGLAVGVGVC